MVRKATRDGKRRGSRIGQFIERAVLVLSVAAAGLVGTASAAATELNPTVASAPSQAPSGFAPASLTLFYHPPKDGTAPQAIAQRYASAVFTRGDESYRDQMRGAGFGGPVLQYLMANEASGPVGLRSGDDRCGEYLYYPNNVSGIAGDFCAALHGDERNFLHNGRGERLYHTQSWQQGGRTMTVAIYLMNPASPAWQAYLASRARAELAELDYDGLFLDNVDISLHRLQRQEDNSDGAVAEFPSRDAYREAVVDGLAALRSGLGGATVWANLVGSYDSPSDWDPYLPYLDGAMNEYFVARWGGTFTNASAWEGQIRQAEAVLAQGKAFMGVAQGEQGDAGRMRFALASYLQVAGPGAYFRYAADSAYSQAWHYDDYQVRLGEPLGTRYQVGTAWRRDFACGSVTVDAGSHTASIQTDAHRPGCS